MIPPFTITAEILDQIGKIERLIGRIESFDHPKPQPHLRKSNRVRTVQGSLAIEGNTLDLEAVTALIEGKTVIGKKNEIREVLNTITAYDQLSAFDPLSLQSLLDAHRIIMEKLIPLAGKWRRKNVGILKGSAVSHVAPKANRVPHLMKELFDFLKSDKNHVFIKSAVFHYELEFIHPFEDGNGRLGRFWHSLLLYNYHSIFEFIPVESLIKEHQKDYYKALEAADKAGDSTVFIEFSLAMVHASVADFVTAIRPTRITTNQRLERARESFRNVPFSRKAYIELFKKISTATASRDLKAGVNLGQLLKQGNFSQTVYQFKD